MSTEDVERALVPAQPAALSKSGAKSLVARGRADLRIKEEAEEWLKRGQDLNKQRNFEAAFACLEHGIELNPNHPEIQVVLGIMYERDGVRQDYAEAAFWYRKAAEQGHAHAQGFLGHFYATGRGVPEDYAQAAVWSRKAAEQGDAPPQLDLGNLYYYGAGIPQDREQAAVWYRKAAEQGFAAAQNRLGTLYRDGEGVPQDCAQAAVWFLKAAEQGNADAQCNLGVLYYNGQGVPQDFGQAAVWFRKAAVQGGPQAQFNLGLLYRDGAGVPQSYSNAYHWFSLAAEAGTTSFTVDVKKYPDTSASHLTPEELSQAQARASKWFAEHPARP
ncbi:MAG: hypothetical protein ACRD3N_07450 [Terracidiphilus sp.]